MENEQLVSYLLYQYLYNYLPALFQGPGSYGGQRAASFKGHQVQLLPRFPSESLSLCLYASYSSSPSLCYVILCAYLSFSPSSLLAPTPTPFFLHPSLLSDKRSRESTGSGRLNKWQLALSYLHSPTSQYIQWNLRTRLIVLSLVERLSLSERVPYRSFHCNSLLFL